MINLKWYFSAVNRISVDGKCRFDGQIVKLVENKINKYNLKFYIVLFLLARIKLSIALFWSRPLCIKKKQKKIAISVY